ncbi:hypothetical protein EPH_0013260 [Eimeria praecox]|uniref:Uncharacterized protein n=1 Tax=Eimeria praecox TaxID=51316 RepID=U6H224_9EIME|nr:hypothetical protein EPH_0013260 [Eimeria praecox]
MVAAGPYRIDREIFALPGLVGCTMLFAAATAREALATDTVESTHVPLNQKGAVPTVLPLENVHPHPYTPLNLVVGQSSGGFGSSVIRGRQKKWERSHFLAFTGGLVAVVYLAVAFVILRCARKALHPRLFGSLSARSLSSSELEEHRVHACIDEKEGKRGEEDEREDEAGDAGAGPDEYLIKEGESKALQALEELQHIVTLGVQALPYLSLEKKFPLILFLMRVCTQELILLGIYSTPKVDLKRQGTINFILHQGEQALAQIVPEDPRNNAAYRTNEILRLLGRFRSAPRKSNGEELGVEASISAYRISECKRALEKLQPWVETSIPIPNDVAERVIKTLTFTRGTGKRRMIVDDAARSWVAEVQARFGCFALMEKNCGAESNLHKRQFDVEMEELQSRYGRLERSLDCSIQSALSGQPPKQELHVQEQHEECMHHQEQALQPLYQQQYHSAYQLPENIGALSSAFQSVEQLAVLRTGHSLLLKTCASICPPLTLRPAISSPLTPPQVGRRGSKRQGTSSNLRSTLLRQSRFFG